MSNQHSDGFPWDIPQQRPKRDLSAAMSRLYDNYESPRPEDNDLFSSFKYTRIEGFDYQGNTGNVSRRDPSKIIKHNDIFYIWYTKRHTIAAPQGPAKCSDEIPSTDWDLAEIWYATSKDGFSWQEQGVAIKRPEKPCLGWRSVSTPDILIWKGGFYLYYQAFMEASGLKGDHCPVTMSMADSPDGPWQACGDVVVPNGAPGEWDQYSIHDPYLLMYKNKIHLYYKAAFGDRPDYLVANGLAIAESPLGPFTKHALNPVLNSGHETCFFPFKKGIAALATRNGNENNTIQYAEDGVNFSLAAVSSLMPIAAGPYVPDAFDDSGNGQGIRWGLAHFCDKEKPDKKFSFLGRFDCNLIPGSNNTDMKETDLVHKPEVYFYQCLSPDQIKARKSNP